RQDDHGAAGIVALGELPAATLAQAEPTAFAQGFHRRTGIGGNAAGGVVHRCSRVGGRSPMLTRAARRDNRIPADSWPIEPLWAGEPSGICPRTVDFSPRPPKPEGS